MLNLLRNALIVLSAMGLIGCGEGDSSTLEPQFVPGSVGVVPRPAEVKVDAAGSVFVFNVDTTVITRRGEDTASAAADLLVELLRGPFPGGEPVEAWGLRQQPNSVLLTTAEADPTLGRDGYELEVTPDGVRLRALAPFGFVHGVQTLRQLLPPDIERRAAVPGVEWSVPSVQIRDVPRFAWRGLLIDTSRTFVAKEFLLRQLELLALYKVSVLHLHLTDDQGWRLEIDAYPRLHELGSQWDAEQAAGALLADLGADVIKVEPPGGDVFRGFLLSSMGYQHDFKANYAFELDNRGKRSVTVALDRPGGPALVRRMSAKVDVFLTNLIQQRCVRYGLTYDEIRTVNPRIIYAAFSGYGTRGPDQNRPGFDYAAFWARAGVMGMLREPPSPPPLCRGGQGDHTTALNILAAVLAALRVRDQTNESQHVEVTLQGTGMYTVATDLQAALIAREQPRRHNRTQPPNPIWNSYRCGDGEWLLLVMPQPDPYWPRFCAMIGKPEWATDSRYDTLAKRREHTIELTRAIDAIFTTHDRAHWAAQLDGHGIIWAPVATLIDVIDDPQVHEMGWLTTIEHPALGRLDTVATPFRIYGADIGPRSAAPTAGAHTFDVLAELDLGDEEIAQLAADGVIG